jgi:hypothetical protein
MKRPLELLFRLVDAIVLEQLAPPIEMKEELFVGRVGRLIGVVGQTDRWREASGLRLPAYGWFVSQGSLPHLSEILPSF